MKFANVLLSPISFFLTINFWLYVSWKVQYFLWWQVLLISSKHAIYTIPVHAVYILEPLYARHIPVLFCIYSLFWPYVNSWKLNVPFSIFCSFSLISNGFKLSPGGNFTSSNSFVFKILLFKSLNKTFPSHLTLMKTGKQTIILLNVYKICFTHEGVSTPPTPPPNKTESSILFNKIVLTPALYSPHFLRNVRYLLACKFQMLATLLKQQKCSFCETANSFFKYLTKL